MTNSLTVESTAFRSLSTLLISFLFGFVSFLLLQLSASCRVAAECKPSKKADVQDLGKEHTEMESKGAESKQFDHVLLIKTYLIIVGKPPPRLQHLLRLGHQRDRGVRHEAGDNLAQCAQQLSH